jgi:glycosyltransferase involved in cell wall biosynthesis
MRVGFVSRWGVRCGIATYSDQLTAALVRQGADVFCAAEHFGGLVPIPTESTIEAFRCWNGRTMNTDDMFVRLRVGRATVAHFQHEFGIMNQPRPLVQLVAALASSGVPSVVTCHTVMPRPFPQNAWFFADLLRQVDAIVVHSEDARSALVDWGHRPDKVRVIPHGTREGCHPEDRAIARQTLGIAPDRVVAVSIGFITPGKMQMETIRGVIGLVQDGAIDPTRFLFVVAGEPGQNDPTNTRYCADIQALVAQEQAAGYIQVIPRFIPVEELPLWYGAADFAITASAPTFFSTSGRAHQEMAFGVPSISTRERLLTDLDETRSVKFDFSATDAGGFRAALLAIMGDPQLRTALSGACLRFADETSWTNVARRHLELYAQVSR